ncbi:MAG: LamG-like jellyroll fold domain-containing protein [Patescibacteria group bacterium]
MNKTKYFGALAGVTVMTLAALTLMFYQLNKTGILALSPVIEVPNDSLQAVIAGGLSDGLVGHWTMDEGTGSIARDSSTRGAHGTLSGSEGLTPTWKTGKIKGGLYFDGTDDKVTAPNVLSEGTNSTIALWVNVPSSVEHGAFIKIGGQNGLALGVGDNEYAQPGSKLVGLIEYRRWIPTGKDIGSGWHHVAMTVDGSGTAIFYIDGKSVGSFPGDAPFAPTGNTHIGGYTLDGALRFAKATLDDVRVYSRVLSATEISSLAALTSTSVDTTTSVVVAPVITAPLNNKPTVSNVSAVVNENGAVMIELTAKDADTSDTLTYYIVDAVRYGVLNLESRVSNNLQKYVYTPKEGFSGTDRFTYRVSDGKISSLSGTVTITVNPKPVSSILPTPSIITLIPQIYPTSTLLSRTTVAATRTPVISPTPAPAPTPTPTPAPIVTPPEPVISTVPQGDYYPQNIYLFKLNSAQRKVEDQNLTLQGALDKYKAVRLENADYRSSGSSVTIRSGYQLYGLPDTKIPKIIVDPGTVGATVHSVWAGTLTFPRGDAVTRDNVFKRFKYTDIYVDNGKLENNLFFDFNFVKTDIDNRQVGYLRDNRFIKFRSQSIAPQILFRGNSNRLSKGNVFVAFNFITPPAEAVTAEGLGDLTFVTGDVEAWDYDSTTKRPLFRVFDTGRFTAYGVSGGGGRSGMYDVNSNNFVLWSSHINSNTSLPHIIVGATNDNAFLVNHDQTSLRIDSSSTKFTAFQDNIEKTPMFNGVNQENIISSGLKTMYEKLFTSPVGTAWPRPSYGAIPDPLGGYWNTDLSSKRDDTQYIQNLINTQKMALLPAGIYYISSSLKINSDQGLIGAGDGKTVIIAKNPSIDMIVSDEHKTGPWFDGIRLVVADLMLQGGRNGIRISGATAGSHAQLTDSIISHITMRNMAVAGIHFDDSYAIDNNVFDNINIVGADVAFKQVPRVGCAGGENPGITYIDKTFFYNSQLVGNRIGFDFPACRANNSVGCIDCLLKDNRVAVARMEATNWPFFINSDFINNGGNETMPTLNSTNHLLIVSSRFTPGNATALLSANRIEVEGSTFGAGLQSAKVLGRSDTASFWNTKSSTALGSVQNGIFVNNKFVEPDLSNLMVSVRNGVQRILVPGSSTPSPHLLVKAAGN